MFNYINHSQLSYPFDKLKQFQLSSYRKQFKIPIDDYELEFDQSPYIAYKPTRNAIVSFMQLRIPGVKTDAEPEVVWLSQFGERRRYAFPLQGDDRLFNDLASRCEQYKVPMTFHDVTAFLEEQAKLDMRLGVIVNDSGTNVTHGYHPMIGRKRKLEITNQEPGGVENEANHLKLFNLTGISKKDIEEAMRYGFK